MDRLRRVAGALREPLGRAASRGAQCAAHVAGAQDPQHRVDQGRLADARAAGYHGNPRAQAGLDRGALGRRQGHIQPLLHPGQSLRLGVGSCAVVGRRSFRGTWELTPPAPTGLAADQRSRSATPQRSRYRRPRTKVSSKPTTTPEGGDHAQQECGPEACYCSDEPTGARPPLYGPRSSPSCGAPCFQEV